MRKYFFICFSLIVSNLFLIAMDKPGKAKLKKIFLSSKEGIRVEVDRALLSLSTILSDYVNDIQDINLKQSDAIESSYQITSLELEFCAPKDSGSILRYKSLRSFINLLKSLLDVKNKKKDPNVIIDKLSKMPLTIKIDCAILAEYLNVPDLFIPCAKMLAQIATDYKYQEQFRFNENFFRVIYTIRAPTICKMAALYLVNNDQQLFKNLFSRIIEKTTLKNFGRNAKFLELNEDENILFTFDHLTKLNLSYLDPENSYKEWKKTTLNHPCPICSFDLSDDYKLLATACIDGKVYIWQVPELRIVNRLELSSKILALKISPNKKFIAAITENNKIIIWNLESNLFNFNDFEFDLCPFIDFDKYSKNVIFASKEGQIIVAFIDDFSKNWVFNQNPITLCSIDRKKKFLITASGNYFVVINLYSQEEICSYNLPNKILKISFSSTDEYAIFLTDKGFYIFDLNIYLPIIFIRKENLIAVKGMRQTESLIVATSRGQIQKIDLSEMFNFLNGNDYLFEQMFFLSIFLQYKNRNIARQKAHIREIFDQFSPTFKKILLKSKK